MPPIFRHYHRRFHAVVCRAFRCHAVYSPLRARRRFDAAGFRFQQRGRRAPARRLPISVDDGMKCHAISDSRRVSGDYGERQRRFAAIAALDVAVSHE